jgi:hypothetical protein
MILRDGQYRPTAWVSTTLISPDLIINLQKNCGRDAVKKMKRNWEEVQRNAINECLFFGKIKFEN